MDTDALVELVRKAKALAWNEGGGGSAGDMSAMIPLLSKALKAANSEEVKKAIFGYNKKAE